jgi:hypothetical protein
MFDSARRSIPDKPTSPEQASFALCYIAGRLRQRTVRPEEYEQTREQLLEEASTRSAQDHRALHDLLPPLSQINGLYANDWDAALDEAELERRPPTPPPTRLGGRWTETDIQGWVRRYATWLKGRPSSDRLWRAFAKAQPGAPSLGALKDRGGLPRLLSEVTRADADTLAETRQRERQETQARARAQAGKTKASHTGPRGQEILDILRSGGPMGALEIATLCGITREAVRVAINRLIALGLVERTDPTPRAPAQQYRAV